MKGMVSSGSTASQRVKARNPWASALPATMPPALNGVKNNNPRVPSRFSRAMQSAVRAGTIRKINPRSSVCRLANSQPPNWAAGLSELATMLQSSSVPTTALQKRSRWLIGRRAPSRSSRCTTGQTPPKKWFFDIAFGLVAPNLL